MDAANNPCTTLIHICNMKRGKYTYEKRTSMWQQKKHIGSFFMPESTFTPRAVLNQMIASSTGDFVPATCVRALCVVTGLARQAWTGVGNTLVEIWREHYIKTATFLSEECFDLVTLTKLTVTVAHSVLNVTDRATLLRVAAERACSVVAHKVWSTVMGAQSTLVYVWNKQRGDNDRSNTEILNSRTISWYE